MESQKSEASDTNKEPTTANCGDIRKHEETPDGGKINTLLDFLNEKLPTGIYGNFWIAGERFANDPRHNTLREVIELRKELQTFNANVAAQKEAEILKAKVMELKKGPKPRGGDAAVTRSLNNQELDTFRRDFALQNERWQVRVQKAEDSAKKNAKHYTALLNKFAALEDSVQAGLKLEDDELKRKIRQGLQDENGRMTRDVQRQITMEGAQTSNAIHRLGEECKELNVWVDAVARDSDNNRENIATLWTWHNEFTTWRDNVLKPGLRALSNLLGLTWLW